MSSTRRKKQKMEKAQRSKALLSPDSLPIVYTDLRSKAVETKPLADFLAWAKEEKVLIFTQAYHDSLFSVASRTVGKAKILCPSIEKDCTSRNGIAEIAEAFYADRNALFVDDLYSGIYKKAVLLVIAREKALRAQNELLESELESNKTVDAAADCERSKLVDVALEYENAAQDACNEEVEGSADVPEHILNEEVVEAECQQDAKECISDAMAEAKVVDGETSKGNAQGCEEGSTELDSSKVYKDADRIAFEGWLLQLEKGKKAVPYDQILIQLLKSTQATLASLDSMKTSMDSMRTSTESSMDSMRTSMDSMRTSTKSSMDSMRTSMKSSMDLLGSDVKSAHKAISDNGESIVRISLAQFLQEKWGQCAKKVSVPIFGRKLPFVYFQPLEDLAKLCLTGEKKSRSLPTDVEIDIFVKVVENGKEKIRYTPPRAPYRVSDELTTVYGFTSFIIGENTRSGSLCKDAYSHPLEADYSGCTKLLYKFIQVERALIATRQYYCVDEKYMEAGLIVSPSFKNMSNAHELIDQVLAGRVQAFANIAHLHAKHKMWLTSM